MRCGPQISIVTPSFNQGMYIEETIRSVICQDYDNVQYIIMDGGSTDQTVSIVKKYEKDISYWVSEKDDGQSDAIERGFALATGSILAWINSDDVLAPGALTAVATAFASADCDIVAGVVSIKQDGNLNYHHRTGCKTGPLSIEQLLDLGNEWMTGRFFYQPEVFFTKDIYVRAGNYIEKRLHFSMDYDLWVRCAKAGAQIKAIDYELARFRAHAAQKTSTVEAFLPELTRHAAQLRDSFGVTARANRTPPELERRRARVGMINDHGFRYGAGRAHKRMAECLAAAQYEVVVYFFLEELGDTKICVFDSAVAAMRDAAVDVVIVGNLHGAFPGGVDLAPLAEIAPVLVVTHDYFSLTGRCPYPLGCDKLLFTCDETCPTKHDYPVIPPVDIAPAQALKLNNMGLDRVRFLANSAYMDVACRRLLAVKRPEANPDDKVRRIVLPIPEAAFSLGDRAAERDALGFEDDVLMVLAVASNLTDQRKGFRHVVEACRLVGSAKIRLCALGWIAPEQRLAEVTYLGSHDDNEALARIYRAADVLISATADDTFGQTFVEAARCGCPSIGYDVGAVPEVCIPGTTGWLVERNDIAGLASCLSRLLRSTQSERNGLRSSAHLFATSHFGAPTFLAGINEVFRDFVAKEEVAIPTGVQFGGLLARPIRFVSDAEVVFRDSFDPLEGPYPEHGIPIRLRWMTACEGTLAVKVPKAGVFLLTLEIGSTQQTQSVSLRRGGDILVDVDLPPAPWSRRRNMAFALDLPQGETLLRLTAEHCVATPERSLYLAVLGTSVTPTACAVGFCGLESDGGDNIDEAVFDAPVLDGETGDTGKTTEAEPTVQLVSGFDSPEGPYPELGVPVRLAWLVASHGHLRLATEPGDRVLVIDLRLPCRQSLVVRVDGTPYVFDSLELDSWIHPTRLQIPLTEGMGPREIEIACSAHFLDDAGRDLRLALLAASAWADASAATSGSDGSSGTGYVLRLP